MVVEASVRRLSAPSRHRGDSVTPERRPKQYNQSKHRAVSGAESTYGGQHFDWDGTHRHHTSHSKQDRWPARPHKRTAAQKHALRPLCFTRAEHLWSAPNGRERARALHARAPDLRADHTRCSRCARRRAPCSWTRRCARALSCDRGSTRCFKVGRGESERAKGV